MNKEIVREVLEELVVGYNTWVDEQMKWQAEMSEKYPGFVAHTDLGTYLRTQFPTKPKPEKES